MSFGLVTSVRNARLSVIAAALDAASAPGAIRLYSGTRPPTSGAAIGGAVLQCTIPLADPCGTVASQVLTFTPAADGIRVAADSITWARFVDGDGNAVMDATVTAAGGGGDVLISATTGATGGLIRMTSGTLSE